MHMKIKLLAVLLALWSLSGATISYAQTDEAPLKIVTTTTHTTDVVSIICGELCEITPLMGAGVDPHLYKPTEQDIAAMNSAAAVFYNGLHLEGQFDAVFAALGERNILTYAIAQPVYDLGYTLTLGDEGTADPHIWNDPRNWQLVAEGVAQQLARLMPTHAETFSTNAEAYIQQLDLLFTWATDALNQVPEEQRVLVTSHDAFQYYADAFGWQVGAIQGISTQDEAGVGDIQGVIDFVVDNALPAVFVESSVPPNTINAVIEGAAARGWQVQIGVRELYSDAMGTPDTFSGTYIGMIAENTLTILQSYGYDVPPFPEGLTPEIPAELLLTNAD